MKTKRNPRTKVNKAFILELKQYAPGKEFSKIRRKFYPVAPSTLWHHMKKHDIKWKRERVGKAPEEQTVSSTGFFRHEDFKGIF